jgi:hypothetical protein
MAVDIQQLKPKKLRGNKGLNLLTRQRGARKVTEWQSVS